MPNVYIDASGTGGILRSSDDQRIFVVCAVFLGNEQALIDMKGLYSEARKILPDSQKEFKSTKNPPANRKFIENMLVSRDWCFCSTLAWKQNLLSTPYERSAQCQRWFIKRALVLKRTALKDGTVIMDKTHQALEDRNLETILKQDKDLSIYPAIQQCYCDHSHMHFGLQLADVIAGAIADLNYSFALGTQIEYENSFNIYNMIKERETVQWKYPFDAGDIEAESLMDASLTIQEKLSFSS